jgi:hypothetical protein
MALRRGHLTDLGSTIRNLSRKRALPCPCSEQPKSAFDFGRVWRMTPMNSRTYRLIQVSLLAIVIVAIFISAFMD